MLKELMPEGPRLMPFDLWQLARIRQALDAYSQRNTRLNEGALHDLYDLLLRSADNSITSPEAFSCSLENVLSRQPLHAA